MYVDVGKRVESGGINAVGSSSGLRDVPSYIYITYYLYIYTQIASVYFIIVHAFNFLCIHILHLFVSMVILSLTHIIIFIFHSYVYIYIMYIIVYNIIINMYIIYGFTTLLHSWAIGSTTYIYIIIQMFGCSAVRLIPFFTLPGEEVCSS